MCIVGKDPVYVEDSYKFFDTDNLEAIVGKVNDEPDLYIAKFKGLYN